MSVILLFVLSFSSLWASQAVPEPAPAAPRLGSWKIDRRKVSVSGVSSGGFMAVQLGVAHSKKIAAVASVAGGVFWCSEGDTEKAKSLCMGNPEGIDTRVQIAKARQLEVLGVVDPLRGLQDQKVFLFASPKDNVIKPLNTEKLAEFYRALAPGGVLVQDNSLESAHGFPTLNAGISCTMPFLPWILRCNYDLAGKILESAYGPLQARGVAQAQNLMTFTQSEFGDEKTPLYKEGWVYVPHSCSRGADCRLHVALHGCQMNPDFIQDKFATLAGYNEWAETNNIIVLYPQSAKIPQDNPYACWDWFGFTGPDYMTQKGSQIKALHSMIERAIQ